MTFSWRFGAMAAMVPNASAHDEEQQGADGVAFSGGVNATDANATDISNDGSRKKIGFGWSLGAMSVANAMQRQQQQQQQQQRQQQQENSSVPNSSQAAVLQAVDA